MTDDETEHTLTREVVETRQYALEIANGELIPGPGGGELMDYEEKATIECTCGERFRKDEKALAHLGDIEDEDGQGGYDRDALFEAYQEAEPDDGLPYVPWSLFKEAYGEGAERAFLEALENDDVAVEETKAGIRADGSWPRFNTGRLWLSFNF